MVDFSNRWMRAAVIVGSCLWCCVFLSTPLMAQTAGSFATISGTVLDPGGNVVPNADVNVKNDLTGVVRSTTTGTDGRFSISSLPVGTYTLEVSTPGFTTARSSGLQLAANGLENISISLNIAAVREEVTVSDFLPVAATLAPTQSSLDARS